MPHPVMGSLRILFGYVFFLFLIFLTHCSISTGHGVSYCHGKHACRCSDILWTEEKTEGSTQSSERKRKPRCGSWWQALQHTFLASSATYYISHSGSHCALCYVCVSLDHAGQLPVRLLAAFSSNLYTKLLHAPWFWLKIIILLLTDLELVSLMAPWARAHTVFFQLRDSEVSLHAKALFMHGHHYKQLYCLTMDTLGITPESIGSNCWAILPI